MSHSQNEIGSSSSTLLLYTSILTIRLGRNQPRLLENSFEFLRAADHFESPRSRLFRLLGRSARFRGIGFGDDFVVAIRDLQSCVASQADIGGRFIF
jgi:hypothetical protein